MSQRWSHDAHESEDGHVTYGEDSWCKRRGRRKKNTFAEEVSCDPVTAEDSRSRLKRPDVAIYVPRGRRSEGNSACDSINAAETVTQAKSTGRVSNKCRASADIYVPPCRQSAGTTTSSAEPARTSSGSPGRRRPVQSPDGKHRSPQQIRTDSLTRQTECQTQSAHGAAPASRKCRSAAADVYVPRMRRLEMERSANVNIKKSAAVTSTVQDDLCQQQMKRRRCRRKPDEAASGESLCGARKRQPQLGSDVTDFVNGGSGDVVTLDSAVDLVKKPLSPEHCVAVTRKGDTLSLGSVDSAVTTDHVNCISLDPNPDVDTFKPCPLSLDYSDQCPHMNSSKPCAQSLDTSDPCRDTDLSKPCAVSLDASDQYTDMDSSKQCLLSLDTSDQCSDMDSSKPCPVSQDTSDQCPNMDSSKHYALLVDISDHCLDIDLSKPCPISQDTSDQSAYIDSSKPCSLSLDTRAQCPNMDLSNPCCVSQDTSDQSADINSSKHDHDLDSNLLADNRCVEGNHGNHQSSASNLSEESCATTVMDVTPHNAISDEEHCTTSVTSVAADAAEDNVESDDWEAEMDVVLSKRDAESKHPAEFSTNVDNDQLHCHEADEAIGLPGSMLVSEKDKQDLQTAFMKNDDNSSFKRDSRAERREKRKAAKKKSHKNDVCPVAPPPLIVSRPESVVDEAMEADEQEESWDDKFDDNGEALDPELLKELTIAVGKVEVQKPKYDYYNYQPVEPDFDCEGMSHLIEIYDFPSSFLTRDLIMAFKDFKDFDLKWVDDTHAIGIFASAMAAHSALDLQSPFMRIRPINMATRQTKLKARRSTEMLQPYKARPETTASVARSLVTRALGQTSRVSKAQRDVEREQLKQARELKRQTKQQIKAAWEGTIGPCAMDAVDS